MPSSRVQTIAKLLIGAVVVTGIILVYVTYRVVQDRKTTGILQVQTPGSGAIITVSQANHEAQTIGTTTARVRLHPGDYLVVATEGGKHASSTAHIVTSQTTKLVLNLTTNSNLLPSPDNIDFQGLNVLTDNGLTNDQVANLRQLFFEFKRSTLMVVIDTASIQSAPHNPRGNDPFSINFTVSIDSTTYRATVQYIGFTNVTLTLSNPETGARVYSGSAPSSPGS